MGKSCLSMKAVPIFIQFIAFCVVLDAFLLRLPETHAHPHVFVANRFRIVFDDEGLAGIQVRWVFDRYFSQMIADEFDTDRDGALNSFEVAVIKKDAFSNLANFDYFTFVKISGKPFEVKYVRNFNSTLKDGVLYYEFLIPCHVKAGKAFKEIRVSPYDPSYYTLVLFAETDAVTLAHYFRYRGICRRHGRCIGRTPFDWYDFFIDIINFTVSIKLNSKKEFQIRLSKYDLSRKWMP
jgi:ABC-type uncharacterized transport system substrate-binding protein